MLVHVGLATLPAACPRWEGTLTQTRPLDSHRNRLSFLDARAVRRAAAADI